MIIDLNKGIDTLEFAKVDVRGKKTDNINVIEMTFSKEALIGFAKNLIWMYEDTDEDDKFYVCTDPLGGTPHGNQVVGFYLTTDSPTFIFSVNSLRRDEEVNCRNETACDKTGVNKSIAVLPPTDDNLLEEYELGFRNLVSVSVYNKNHVDISREIYEVSFQINHAGLKNLGIILLKLADAYNSKMEYFFEQATDESNVFKSGIVLTHDSISVKIKCADLGTVYDFEPDFGQ